MRPSYSCNSLAAAEQLEAQGHFTQAAKLYEEAATVMMTAREHLQGGRCHELVTFFLNNAGLACKRAQLFDQAESLYVQSVQMKLGTLVSDDQLPAGDVTIAASLTNLLRLYEDQLEHKMSTVGMLMEPDFRLSTTFAVLLARTGHPVLRGFILNANGARPFHEELLLPQYRSQSNATRALIEALCSTTVADYQDMVVKCRKPTMSFVPPRARKPRVRRTSQGRSRLRRIIAT